MSAPPSPRLTGSVGIDVAELARRLQHAVVIGAAAGADAQVDRGAREALARIAGLELDLDVLVHDRHAGVATRVAFLGAQERVERLEVGHASASASVSG